jgi:hypothetical protein
MQSDSNSNTGMKKFFIGLTLGIMFGCLIGYRFGESDKSPANNSQTIELAEPSIQSVASNATQSLTPLPENGATSPPSSTQTSTPTNTPAPSFLSIPYTSCGEHIAYSANAEVIEIPIIENDQIIEYASLVRITYKIKNTYINTPIYGFEVRPSPGYGPTKRYPNTLFNSNAPFQPNDEVILKSEHLFVPEDWKSGEHPTAFWKFPESIPFHPRPYERSIGGYTVNFQIVEKLSVIDDRKEEVRCDGAIRVK